MTDYARNNEKVNTLGGNLFQQYFRFELLTGKLLHMPFCHKEAYRNTFMLYNFVRRNEMPYFLYTEFCQPFLKDTWV